MWRTWGRCATCGCARGWPHSPWRATRCACGRGPALPTRCVSGPPAARAPEGEALWGPPRSQRPLCPPEHGPHPGWATGASPGHICRAQPACPWNLPTIITLILLYRWGPSGPQPDPTEPPARNSPVGSVQTAHGLAHVRRHAGGTLSIPCRPGRAPSGNALTPGGSPQPPQSHPPALPMHTRRSRFLP